MSAMELLDRAAGHVQAQDLTFQRAGFYVIASMLAWRMFWELADRYQGNPTAQTLSWVVVIVAVWLVENF